jgi:glycosyltransferase involved in cell wall biosynthesis
MSEIPHRLFYLCYYSGDPTGGIKKVYEHVDILNQTGYPAYVVHNDLGYRYAWYQYAARIPVAYMESVDEPFITLDAAGNKEVLAPLSQNDILVIPEPWAYKIAPYLEHRNFSGVIFNQNAHYTFRELHHPLHPFLGERDTHRIIPYLSKNNLGTLVVSQENQEYLEYTFPHKDFHLVRLSCDERLFYFNSQKKKQIAYMPRKCRADALQVIEILRLRNKLDRWLFYPIENQTEEEVARILRESAIFMSFSHREGFGLPPLEAMACGCIVIGYHGQAGKEFLKEPYAYPITEGEIVQFAQKVEEIALQWDKDPTKYEKQGNLAADYIRTHYSNILEKEDLINAWKKILIKQRQYSK